jgi:hypothetical protein
LQFLKKAVLGYLIFVGAMLFIALLTLAVSSSVPAKDGEFSSGVKSETTAKNIEVAWVSSDAENKLSCAKYWNCTFVEVTSASYCSALKLDFSVLDGKTQARLVDATSYSPEIYANTPSFIELGFNNLLEKNVLFSFPLVSCTEPLLVASWETGMYNFPTNYCDDEYPSLCTSTGVPAQDWPSGGGGSLDWYGGGTTVLCNDGWVSNSGGKQGACSSHGGVAD